jgi:hypothetical protein
MRANEETTESSLHRPRVNGRYYNVINIDINYLLDDIYDSAFPSRVCARRYIPIVDREHQMMFQKSLPGNCAFHINARLLS